MDQINLFFEPLFRFLESIPQAGLWYTNTIRFVMPFLALGVLIDVLRSLLRVENPTETWGYLETPEGEQLPIAHWENTLGRAPSSDVVLSYPSVSRTHAGLIRDDEGEWTITDLGSKGGTLVNGEEVGAKPPSTQGIPWNWAAWNCSSCRCPTRKNSGRSPSGGRKAARCLPGARW